QDDTLSRWKTAGGVYEAQSGAALENAQNVLALMEQWDAAHQQAQMIGENATQGFDVGSYNAAIDRGNALASQIKSSLPPEQDQIQQLPNPLGPRPPPAPPLP